jgi:hypothetical protein
LMRTFGRWNWWLPKIGTKTNRASNNFEISGEPTTNGTNLDLLAHSSSER